MKLTYLGHSAFEIETSKKKILIDPFLVKVPNYVPQDISDIFVTHGHGDHLGSAIEIAKKTGAKITAVFELANYCASQGAKTNDVALGAWNKYEWGRVIPTPAFHGNSTPDGKYAGPPCGFVFDIEGKKLYHAGDTSLSAEMKVIGEIYKPDISLLPIGGKYTMDIEHALIASEWLNSKTIIPMHYNTFEAINVNINEFVSGINSLEKTACVMKVMESITI